MDIKTVKLNLGSGYFGKKYGLLGANISDSTDCRQIKQVGKLHEA
jgi:hypothetical protein